MKAHETTHTPFLCPHPGCGLRFSTVAIKNRHAKSHTTNPVVSLPTTSSGNIGAEFKRPRRSNADKEKPSNETSTKKARIARGRMRISTTSSKNQQREDDANTTNLLSRPAAPLSTGSGSHKGSTGSAAKDKRFIWEVDDTDTDSESSSSVSTPKSRQTYRLPSTIFSKSQQDDANTSNLLSRPAAPLSTGSGSHKGSTGTADCDGEYS
ncbi:hypothetical protein F5H01DRAFT_317288 [Linnemannia elongata]|nr:hypothetical protein F5H01DRAFT_317288 [Linnemannia elongata]